MAAQPSVLSFICSVVPRFHDAQDILQQVAVEVARGFDRYDPERPFVAWAIGIAKNMVGRHYRNQTTGVCIFSELSLERLAEQHVSNHPRQNRMLEALEDCVATLDTRAVELLQLKYTESLTSEAIAQKMQTESGTVRSALRRIRVRLQDCIERRVAVGDGR